MSTLNLGFLEVDVDGKITKPEFSGYFSLNNNFIKNNSVSFSGDFENFKFFLIQENVKIRADLDIKNKIISIDSDS